MTARPSSSSNDDIVFDSVPGEMERLGWGKYAYFHGYLFLLHQGSVENFASLLPPSEPLVQYCFPIEDWKGRRFGGKLQSRKIGRDHCWDVWKPRTPEAFQYREKVLRYWAAEFTSDTVSL